MLCRFTPYDLRCSIRHELEPIINEQNDTIKKLGTKCDTEAAGRKLLVQKYNECTNEINKLKPRSDRLFEVEERMRSLQRELDAMEIAYRDTKQRYFKLEKDFKELQEQYDEKSRHLEKESSSLHEQKRHVRSLRQSISKQDQEFMVLTQALDEMREREFRRLNALSSVEIQCDPDVASIGIQTEFIIPAVKLYSIRMSL